MANELRTNYMRNRDFVLNLANIYNERPNIKIYLELILSITTITLFLIFAIKPTVLTIVELDKEIKGKEQTVAKMKQKVKDLQVASQILTNDAQRINMITVAVPEKAMPESFITQVETYANQNSVTITSLAFSEVVIVGETNSADTKLPFNLSLTGQYPNLLSFLMSIENLKRPVGIESFTVSIDKSKEERQLTLNMSGNLPYLNEKK